MNSRAIAILAVMWVLLPSAPVRADDAEDKVVKAIKKLGGEVVRDNKAEGKPVVGVNLGRTKLTDAGLKDLKKLQNLQNLDLSFTKVTDAGLKEIKEFKSLQGLFLNNTRVTDAGLKELKDLERLEILV